MSACGWLMDHGRGCARTGTRRFGGLRFCHQHFDLLLVHMQAAIFADELDDSDVTNPALATRSAARDAFHWLDKPKRELEQRRKQERLARQLVYFVERDGFCKIGYTTNLKRRLLHLNTGSCLIEGMTVGPVRTLATIPGADEDSEKWHHRRFDHLRVGGEWFLLDEELRTYIGNLKGCVASELKAAS